MGIREQIANVIDQVGNVPNYQLAAPDQWAAIASQLPPGYSLAVTTGASYIVAGASGGTVYGWDGSRTPVESTLAGLGKGSDLSISTEVDFVKGGAADLSGPSEVIGVSAIAGRGYSIPEGSFSTIPIVVGGLFSPSKVLANPDTALGYILFPIGRSPRWYWGWPNRHRCGRDELSERRDCKSC